MKKRAFSLAEFCTVLATIGVLAAIVMPALINNRNQSQYLTGFKKGVTLINNAISMNIASGHGSALKTTEDNPLYLYLQNNLKVIKKTETSLRNNKHSEFFTPDGMRFEFPKGTVTGGNDDFSEIKIDGTTISVKGYSCGTKGLEDAGSIKSRLNAPCAVLLDVNGDDPPNKLTSDETSALSDMFIILVTDKTAIPYGATAQKAYYGR